MRDAPYRIRVTGYEMRDYEIPHPESRISNPIFEVNMSYRTLEIWQLARDLSVEIHRMTLESLPKLEMYEEASQIRRSAKSIRSNIVEGYGRRRYKLEFIRFLTYAHASCDETIDHLETLYETRSLADDELYERLHQKLNQLGGKLNQFIQGVELQHRSVREDSAEYTREEEK
jgi:four helix bundle protein